MKRTRLSMVAVGLVGFSLVGVTPVFGQTPLGSGWTYQGKLDLLGSSLNDTADFEFSLHDDATLGNQVGSTVTVSDVTVVDGLFTAELDFGFLAFNGDARWLEIAVRSPAGSGVFTTLSPRQLVTFVPEAIHALTATSVGGVLFTPGGNVGIGTTTPTDALLDVEGNIRTNDNDIFLRGGSDRNHGVGWYGLGKEFDGTSLSGCLPSRPSRNNRRSSRTHSVNLPTRTRRSTHYAQRCLHNAQ